MVLGFKHTNCLFRNRSVWAVKCPTVAESCRRDLDVVVTPGVVPAVSPDNESQLEPTYIQSEPVLWSAACGKLRVKRSSFFFSMKTRKLFLFWWPDCKNSAGFFKDSLSACKTRRWNADVSSDFPDNRNTNVLDRNSRLKMMLCLTGCDCGSPPLRPSSLSAKLCLLTKPHLTNIVFTLRQIWTIKPDRSTTFKGFLSPSFGPNLQSKRQIFQL